MGRWAPLEVIASALTGNEIAVEELLAAIWPACFRLATMVTGDRGLAQDAAQETCVIVHRQVRALRRVDAFDANGELTKDSLKTVLQQYIDAFAAHVAKHQG